jgi:hypothetical protein
VRLLSWTSRKEETDIVMALWTLQAGGKPVMTEMKAHTGAMRGVEQLPDEEPGRLRCLSWASDCTVRLWDKRRGADFTSRALQCSAPPNGAWVRFPI